MDLLRFGRAGLLCALTGCVWISADRHNDAIDADGDGVSAFDECDDNDPRNQSGSGLVFTDSDGDGFGRGEALNGCMGPGLALMGGDCDDLDPAVNPGAAEVCDPLDVDEDCDGFADDDDPEGAIGAFSWFIDADGDGVGLDAGPVSCDGSAGLASVAGDCDDTNDQIFPGAVERCGGVDDDCDGETDEAGAVGTLAWFTDADLDGYGDPFDWIEACEGSFGTVENNLDCDDSAAYISPAANELCDVANIDEDCDGGANEADPDAGVAFADVDEDGFGDPDVPADGCPVGYVLDESDCDDADPDAYPGNGCPPESP